MRAIKGFERITVLLPDYIGGLPSDLRPCARAIPNIIPVSEAVTPWESREPLVVAVSRLFSNKRIDVLITAWADVASRFPAWRLEIYGEGPEETALQARIADLGLEGNVRLMGLTQDVASVYDRARLLAHPSLFERFPLAIGEALARGVPVIGFADCPGLNSMLQDGSNGRLVAPGADRAAALATALADLLADSTMLQSLGENGPPQHGNLLGSGDPRSMGGLVARGDVRGSRWC